MFAVEADSYSLSGGTFLVNGVCFMPKKSSNIRLTALRSIFAEAAERDGVCLNITAWFKRNPGDWQYAILDDDDDMGIHIDHLVRTDFDLGLTEKEADRCIELLQKDLYTHNSTGRQKTCLRHH